MALKLFGSVLQDKPFIQDISKLALNWRRSIRLQGGFWMGSFSLEGELPQLQTWFYERLGWHIEESFGGTTWEGFIFEMELTQGGVKRRVSLEKMFNAVKTRFTNESNIASETSWGLEAESVRRYGRKEGVTTENNVSTSVAESKRDAFLQKNAWPLMVPVGFSGGAKNKLDVVCCGYIFTANWLFGSVADGGIGSASDWVANTVIADCPLLEPGNIETNPFQIRRELGGIDSRGWNIMANVASFGDGSGTPWRIYVGPERLLHYEPIDITPHYYLRERGLYNRAGGQTETSPWLVQPGVVRDIAYPVSRGRPSGPLADVRDFFIDEVEVNEGKISFKPTVLGDDV